MSSSTLSPTSQIVARVATCSAERYAQHVAETVRDNTAFLLDTRGDDPEARAWACVAELIDVVTSTIAANAARGDRHV